MEIKAVIFDLDGVIVRTDGLHYRAWKHVADAEGIYFDEQINNRLRGVSRMESLDIILERAEKKYSETEKQKLAAEKNAMYVEMLSELNKNDILDGVSYTINELKEKGVKVAIGSSSKNAGYILEKLGITDSFDAICDGNDIKNSKPDPEVFLTAARMLSIENQFCAVVEDAAAGIDAANSAGMVSFAVHDACGYASANYSLAKVEDILDLVLEVTDK